MRRYPRRGSLSIRLGQIPVVVLRQIAHARAVLSSQLHDSANAVVAVTLAAQAIDRLADQGRDRAAGSARASLQARVLFLRQLDLDTFHDVILTTMLPKIGAMTASCSTAQWLRARAVRARSLGPRDAARPLARAE